ncbi:MAG: PEP-CTERM sorting domain-containing protein [Pirellulaceae bacterium]
MLTTPPKNRRQKTSILNKARWAGYVAAGAATALGAHESAEAGIVDPVPLDATVGFDPEIDITRSAVYGIDLTDDGLPDLLMGHMAYSNGGVVKGSAYAMGYLSQPFVQIAGFEGNGTFYASRLNRNSFVSSTKEGQPRLFEQVGLLAVGDGFTNDQFLEPGTGYIGFSFNAGAGTQYGWLQVTMDTGTPKNAFTVVDYAYAGIGERIRAGHAAVPEPGSLGLLATGAIGLLLWRRKRRSSLAKA